MNVTLLYSTPGAAVSGAQSIIFPPFCSIPLIGFHAPTQRAKTATDFRQKQSTTKNASKFDYWSSIVFLNEKCKSNQLCYDKFTNMAINIFMTFMPINFRRDVWNYFV